MWIQNVRLRLYTVHTSIEVVKNTKSLWNFRWTTTMNELTKEQIKQSGDKTLKERTGMRFFLSWIGWNRWTDSVARKGTKLKGSRVLWLWFFHTLTIRKILILSTRIAYADLYKFKRKNIGEVPCGNNLLLYLYFCFLFQGRLFLETCVEFRLPSIIHVGVHASLLMLQWSKEQCFDIKNFWLFNAPFTVSSRSHCKENFKSEVILL